MAELPLSAATLAIIRNEPVQARSHARLTALLDAAAQVIDEIGFERLTTAMVADRAGASIGTVYRYFPDRISVLQNLAARNVERTTARALERIRDPEHGDWLSALSAAFEVFVEAYREEPGFASLRLGDVVDLRPAIGVPAIAVFAAQLHDALVERFSLPDSPESRDAVEAAVVLSDAIAARAFTRVPQGDEGFLDYGRRATISLLSEYFGEPRR